MMEWKPASVPFYEVSECGDLRLLQNRSTLLAGTILKGTLKRGGYREYKVHVDGVGTRVSAHREVLLAFLGQPPTPDHQCAHWDGDPLNNHYRQGPARTPHERAKKLHGRTGLRNEGYA